jgi:hypothetical protein
MVSVQELIDFAQNELAKSNLNLGSIIVIDDSGEEYSINNLKSNNTKLILTKQKRIKNDKCT